MVEIRTYQQSDRQRLKRVIQSAIGDDSVVLLCIGTEKVFADSLGPVVGSLVSDALGDKITVYGVRGDNVTAQNLTYTHGYVRGKHPDSKIVVIDAAVGGEYQFGAVQVDTQGIYPGAATDKQLGKVGDVSIIGITATGADDDFYTLYPGKSLFVEQLAKVIADAIVGAVA